MCKQEGPSAAPALIQSKRTCISEADGEDADIPALQLTHSSTAPVCSVSLHWLVFVEMFLTLCMFLIRQLLGGVGHCCAWHVQVQPGLIISYVK